QQPPAEAQERPEKPAECADGCPPQQVCDHCQWPPGPDAEAQAQGGGEVAGWVLEDTFVNAKFWTADTPPQGWTPVYYTAPPSAPVGAEDIEVLKRLRAALPDVGMNGWWLGVE